MATGAARLAPSDRRRQILTAAQELFSSRHYTTVSLEEVATAAGVTRGLVHHYFGSKHDLHVEVVREMFRGGVPPVPEYLTGATAEDRIAESTDRWLDMVERNSDTWLAALGAEGLGNDQELVGVLEHVRESAVDNVIEVLGAGPVAGASPELRGVIKSFGGLAEAATREWLRAGRFTREQVHTLLTSSLARLVEDVLPLVEASDGRRA
jgi:AcrR family transcriptional regulator